MKNTTANIGIGILLLMLAARVYTIDNSTDRESTKLEQLINVKKHTRLNALSFGNFSPILPSKSRKEQENAEHTLKVSPQRQPAAVKIIAVNEVETEKENTEPTDISLTEVKVDSMVDFPLDAGNTINRSLSLHFPRKRIIERRDTEKNF
jgi:hypothetical protein